MTQSTAQNTRLSVTVARPDLMVPHSVEAEEAVLGSLIIDPFQLPTIASHITTSDFFIVKNAWVFEAMLDLLDTQQEIDYVTIAQRLKNQGRLEEIGGAAYLTYLLNNTPTSLYAETYALIMQAAADRRKLLVLASDLAQLTHDEEKDIKTAYTEFMSQIIEARPRSMDRNLTMGIEIFDRFMELQSRDDGEVLIFPLPFSGEDEGLPFMTGGKLFGLGGDEKTGKTALAETLAEHWTSLRLRGFYIHTEEKPDDKIYRRYSRWSGIPFLKLEAGKLNETELAKRMVAIEYTQNWDENLNLYYASLPTPAKVMTLIHRAVQVFGSQFVVLDNFTDVRFEDNRTNPAIQAMHFLQELDDLAVRYNILIMITTQMSTQESGKRIAFGTSAFAKKCSWFWDLNRKRLKGDLVYRADGELHTLKKGDFDPRVDIGVPASRYGRGAIIPSFADLRRFYWRNRKEVQIVSYDESNGGGF
jgi:replicative DNA helicase